MNNCGSNKICKTVMLAVATTLVIALLPSAALAGQRRLPAPFSPLTGAGSGVTIHGPSGVAVDEATGNVFVTEENGSSDAILILNGEGGGAPPVGLAPNGSGEYKIEGVSVTTEPQGLAYDNSESAARGTLYFFEAGSIKKFTRNAVAEQYEAAGEIPVPGTENPAGMTVDGEGNVWLGDFTTESVREFSPAGALLHEYYFGFSPTNRPSGLAVDSDGNLYVQRQAGGGVYRYPANGSGEIEVSSPEVVTTESSFGVAYGPASDHIFVTVEGGVVEFDAGNLETIAKYGEGTLSSNIERVAVNSDTDRVYVADLGSSDVAVFGSLVSIPDVTTEPPLNVSGTTATLAGLVNPQGVEVTECKFEYGLTTAYGQTAPCEGAIPTDSVDHDVTASVTGLQADGTTYHYRLVVESANGQVRGTDLTLVTLQTATTEPATEVADTSATLNGTVRPEGEQLTECFFEWGKTSLYGQTTPCSPSAASIPADFASHAVSAHLGELDPNTTYHYRLVKVTASGTTLGQDLTLTTQGAPLVVEQRALQVEQGSAILRAKINPAGSPTTYHFEWGEGSSFDHRVPLSEELVAGSGTETVTVSTNISGLSPATAYSFRIVASNSYGTTTAPGQFFETLDLEGLPYKRAFELVSPADKRPVGNMEQLATVHQLYQATESGDHVGYLVLNGVEGSPAGGEVVYAGSRSSAGWSHTEITPPPVVSAPEANGEHFAATPGFVRYLDPRDLKCGLVESYNPLTTDTPSADTEFGVFNLYRWNAASDSYTLITNRIPLNPNAHKPGADGFYKVAGVSSDCSRIIFQSKAYTFISGATGLYEWNEGVLRDAALRPDGSTPSLSSQEAARVAREKNSVGPDGRFFFTAASDEGADAGQAAVFVRKSPTEVVDASQPTNGSTLGARYAGASPDGSHVFFLGNYGIADSSSLGPIEECAGVSLDNTLIHDTACDLYAYDVEDGTLTDISVDTNPADSKGAVVQGVMASSRDGSVVYFAARGQLVPDKGRTYAENLQGPGFANVYRYDAAVPPAEAVTYVGSLTAEDVRNQALIMSSSATNNWSSQTTDDGDYFLYASRDGLEVNNPDAVESAYLFSALAGSTSCVSCPVDGSAPKERVSNIQFVGIPSVIAGMRPGGSNVQPVSLSEDGRVVFNSEEALAPGAVEGHGEHLGTAAWQFLTQTNIYEWDQGQVSTLATGAAETLGVGGPSGRDVFIKSFSRLSAQDFDFSADVYDIRSGGGFPPPPSAPVPCDPVSGACEGPSSSPPASGVPASGSFVGPGNPPGKRSKRCRKGKVRRHSRCVRKHRHKAHKRHTQSRSASANRGGAR